MRELYHNHPNYFRIGGIVVLVILLLLLLKSCSKEDTIVYDKLDTYIKEVKSKDKESTKTVDNLSYYWGSGAYEIFICDEETSKVLEAFGHEFIALSKEYKNMLYTGEESFSDQEYFNTKFEYYDSFGKELLSLSKYMQENNEKEVLNQFDKLQEILEEIEEGNVIYEAL